MIASKKAKTTKKQPKKVAIKTNIRIKQIPSLLESMKDAMDKRYYLGMPYTVPDFRGSVMIDYDSNTAVMQISADKVYDYKLYNCGYVFKKKLKKSNYYKKTINLNSARYILITPSKDFRKGVPRYPVSLIWTIVPLYKKTDEYGILVEI